MVKRFYKQVDVGDGDGGFTVLLDNRALKTPQRAVLSVPTRALALAIAQEWNAQVPDIRTDAMPLTRLAFTAIDGTAGQRQAVIDQALGYGRTDLLCYRAETPDALAARQTSAWDPLLEWLAGTHGAALRPVAGIIFAAQPQAALAALQTVISGLDGFMLTALVAATTVTGSLTLGLALLAGRLGAAEAFTLSRLDETFQAEKWGLDSEAEARAARLLADLRATERFMRLLG